MDRINDRCIIFVPGKNPKPLPAQHHQLLWRTLLEGVRRAEPTLESSFCDAESAFELIAWNELYYHTYKDISRDLPWIDRLIHQHGPTEQDIAEAHAWHRRLDRVLYSIGDRLPFLIRFLPEKIRLTAKETRRYFHNTNDIAHEIRSLLKKTLRQAWEHQQRIMLIGHSLGSVIAYDTLWELSHQEEYPGKVDMFLTIGSPLGMHYVQRRIQGHDREGLEHYPTIIRRWVNVASVGDVTALDRAISDDFHEMIDIGVIESIEDHCEGIYNFFRNEQGLNCHRSYGYLVNPAVGKIIADWWQTES